MIVKDDKCQLCSNYDNCIDHKSSKNCDEYEFYKCVRCVDRVIESDNIPRCFRGGMKCHDIQWCSNSKEI